MLVCTVLSSLALIGSNYDWYVKYLIKRFICFYCHISGASAALSGLQYHLWIFWEPSPPPLFWSWVGVRPLRKGSKLQPHLPLKKSIPWGKNWGLCTLTAEKLRCRQSHRYSSSTLLFPLELRKIWPNLANQRVDTEQGCALMPHLLRHQNGIPAFTSQISESKTWKIQEPYPEPQEGKQNQCLWSQLFSPR